MTSTEHPSSPPSKKKLGAGSAQSSSTSVHPFFSSKPTTSGSFVPSPPTVRHFLHLDPFSVDVSSSTSTVKSDNNGAGPSTSRQKVDIVFYDLDGTLIKTRTGGDFPSSRSDWQWWDASVPSRLRKEWQEGKHIVVLSNQGDPREKIRSEWKAKLPLIAAKVSIRTLSWQNISLTHGDAGWGTYPDHRGIEQDRQIP